MSNVDPREEFETVSGKSRWPAPLFSLNFLQWIIHFWNQRNRIMRHANAGSVVFCFIICYEPQRKKERKRERVREKNSSCNLDKWFSWKIEHAHGIDQAFVRICSFASIFRVRKKEPLRGETKQKARPKSGVHREHEIRSYRIHSLLLKFNKKCELLY